MSVLWPFEDSDLILRVRESPKGPMAQVPTETDAQSPHVANPNQCSHARKPRKVKHLPNLKET
jgi:hypothetical protein